MPYARPSNGSITGYSRREEGEGEKYESWLSCLFAYALILSHFPPLSLTHTPIALTLVSHALSTYNVILARRMFNIHDKVQLPLSLWLNCQLSQ